MNNRLTSKKGFPVRTLVKKTGVSKEAIHFYIREGILPRGIKTNRNVAYYNEEHIRRLKQIKELQTRFIPLKIIKHLLTAKGKDVEEKLHELQIRLHLPGDVLSTEGHFSFEEIKERTGLSSEDLKRLKEMGIISPSSGSGGKIYEREDLELALLVKKLKEAGFSEEKGFTGISGLTLYTNHVKEIVEEEIRRFLENLPENLNLEEASNLVDKGIELHSNLIVLLRKKLIKQKGREILEGMKIGKE